MHILIVGDHPMPGDFPRGGVERVVQSLRASLSREARVTLIVPRARSETRHSDEHGEIIYLGPSRLPPFLGYWSTVSRRIGRLVDEIRLDVVHIHDAAGYALAWRKMTFSCPVVYTVHGIMHLDVMNGRDALRRATAQLRSAVIGRVERVARARIGNVVVINDYVLEALPDVVAMNLYRIPNPVEAVFARTPISPGRCDQTFELLQVGQVSRRKNSLGAIELAGELARLGRSVRLDFVGPVVEQEYLELCKSTAARLGIDERVHFHGPLPPAEVARRMDHADVLLITSQQENAPMVLAEAQCRGVPVAAPYKFGMRTMIEQGVNGIFLDLPSLEDNAAKLERFLAEGIDHEAIATAARKTYDIDVVTSRTLEAYDEVVRRYGRATVPVRVPRPASERPIASGTGEGASAAASRGNMHPAATLQARAALRETASR